MNGKTPDPIECAIADCASAEMCEFLKQNKRLMAASINSDQKQKHKWDAAWRVASNAIRVKFRSQFKAKCWKGLSLQFGKPTYSINWINYQTHAYIEYHAWWKGLEIYRHFSPSCMEDVVMEATRLGAALAAWDNQSK